MSRILEFLKSIDECIDVGDGVTLCHVDKKAILPRWVMFSHRNTGKDILCIERCDGCFRFCR